MQEPKKVRIKELGDLAKQLGVSLEQFATRVGDEESQGEIEEDFAVFLRKFFSRESSHAPKFTDVRSHDSL